MRKYIYIYVCIYIKIRHNKTPPGGYSKSVKTCGRSKQYLAAVIYVKCTGTYASMTALLDTEILLAEYNVYVHAFTRVKIHFG